MTAGLTHYRFFCVSGPCRAKLIPGGEGEDMTNRSFEEIMRAAGAAAAKVKRG
jgi:hypothetical protein